MGSGEEDTRPLLCLGGGIWTGQTVQCQIEAEVRHKCTNTHCQSQAQCAGRGSIVRVNSVNAKQGPLQIRAQCLVGVIEAGTDGALCQGS